MADKIFLLGVGCQKGGTTWLYEYLQAHPNCEFGMTKEYHIFDGLFEPNAENFFRQKMSKTGHQLIKRARRKPGSDPNGDMDLAQKLLYASFYLNPENYAEYFAKLHAASPDTQVVGDITPSYNMLTAQHLLYIRGLLEPHGFKVKVVFLMRDPVDRCVSAIRMFYRDKMSKRAPDKRPTMDDLFRRRSVKGGCVKRTEYDRTIRAVDEVFDPQDVHYGFYETLFSNEGLKQITDFIGVPMVDADFGRRVNASPSKEVISDDALQLTRRFYNDTYHFCLEKFGSDRINVMWPYANFPVKD